MIGKLIGHAGDLRHSIRKHLRGKGLEIGVEKELLIAAIRGRGEGRELVGARLGDLAHEPAEIEPVPHEIRGQGVEQRGVRRRIRRAQIVHRLYEPASEQMLPDAIHEIASEHGIVARHQPVRQRRPRIGCVRLADNAAERAPGHGLSWDARPRHGPRFSRGRPVA